MMTTTTTGTTTGTATATVTATAPGGQPSTGPENNQTGVEVYSGPKNKYTDVEVYLGSGGEDLVGYELSDQEVKLYLYLVSASSDLEVATQGLGAHYVFEVDQPMSCFSVTIPVTISYELKCIGAGAVMTNMYIFIEQFSNGKWVELASQEVYYDMTESAIEATKDVDIEIQLKANFENSSLQPDNVYRLKTMWGAHTVVPIVEVESIDPSMPTINVPLGVAQFTGNHTYGTGHPSWYALVHLKAPILAPPEEVTPQSRPERSSGALGVIIASPVAALLSDPEGRLIGFDPVRMTVVSEIPGGYYSGKDTHPQVIAVPERMTGEYRVELFGVDNGDFSLNVVSVEPHGAETSRRTFTGSIRQGEKQEYTVEISSGHTLTNVREMTWLDRYVAHPAIGFAIAAIGAAGGVSTIYLRQRRRSIESSP